MSRERDEVVAFLEDYIRAFETGTREDLQAFCQSPVAYVTDSEVQLRERYPFDPVKLREKTGLARSEMRIDVLHLDAHRAHVALEGTRQTQRRQRHRRGRGRVFPAPPRRPWKITLISGIRKELGAGHARECAFETVRGCCPLDRRRLNQSRGASPLAPRGAGFKLRAA